MRKTKFEKQAEAEIRERPRLMRQRDVIKAVQSEGILKRIIAAGWLTPVVREKKYTAYRRSDVDAVVDRILSGEMPPHLPVKRCEGPNLDEIRRVFAPTSFIKAGISADSVAPLTHY